MEEWKEYTIEDVLELLIDYRGKTPKKSETGIPTLSAKSVKMNHIDYSQCYYISKEEYDRFMIRGFPKKGDILLTTEAPLGMVARLDRDDIALGQRLITLRGKKDVLDNGYLLYYFQSPAGQYNLKSRETGTTVTGIKQSEFRKLRIPIPSLPTQQKIAAILSSLDDKIELNNKINTNLEHQAQALFKNFSEKSSKSIKFTDLIDILGGGTPKTNIEDYWNGNIPFFTPKDVGNPYCLTTEKTITEKGLDNCNSKLYPVNTFFVTARGTVGKVSLAGLPMAMNQSCYALKSKDDNQLLAYFYTLEAINSLKHKANGATFDAIVTRDFETETINVLSEQDTKEFTQIVKPIFEMILTNQKENINLSNLRDTLLPKLMNGEIEV